MKIRNLIYVFPFLLVFAQGFSQFRAHPEEVEEILSEEPIFSIFNENYFVSGIPTYESPNRDNSDAKFQVSFKLRPFQKSLFWDTRLYITYNQRSFWNIYQKSGPFRSTDYMPGIQLSKPLYKNEQYQGTLSFIVEHHSNGKSGHDSHSWNLFALGYRHYFLPEVSAFLKLWIPWGAKDNSDVADYIGYGELGVSWMIQKNRWFLDLSAEKGRKWNTIKGNFEGKLSFRPWKKMNLDLMVAVFEGYAENVSTYNHRTGMIRFGFILRPDFIRFD